MLSPCREVGTELHSWTHKNSWNWAQEPERLGLNLSQPRRGPRQKDIIIKDRVTKSWVCGVSSTHTTLSVHRKGGRPHLTGRGLAAPRGSTTSRVGPKLRCETPRTDASPLKGRKPTAFALGCPFRSEVCTSAAGHGLENPRGSASGDWGAVRNFSPEHWMKAPDKKNGADPIGVTVKTLPVSPESRLWPARGQLMAIW